MKAPANRVLFLLGLGVALSFWALSPGSLTPAGETSDEITAARAVLNALPGNLFPDWQAVGAPPRTGFLELIVHLPFLIAARLVSALPDTQELILAIEPVLLSTLIVLLVFLWSERLTGDRLRAIGYALVAAFCTLIWPYAYFGMEVQQSLFLLLAAFMALAGTSRRGWGWWVLFGLCCGMILSVKPSSIVLAPAVAFLIFRSHARDKEPGRIARMWAAISITLMMFLANTWWRNGDGGLVNAWSGFLGEHSVADPLAWAFNVVALIGSPGKGLIVYVPVAIVAAICFRRAWERQRDLAIFTMLALVSLTAALATVDYWSDETWGPRHLHALAAPLVLLVAASSRPGERARARAPLFAAAFLGFCVSFFGATYDYRVHQRVAELSGQSTLQTLQMNAAWNHVKFNARLLRVWLTTSPGDEVYWKAEPVWYYDIPDWASQIQAVRIDPWSTPQALLIAEWGAESPGPGWLSVFASLLAGPALLFICVVAGLADRRGVPGQWTEAEPIDDDGAILATGARHSRSSPNSNTTIRASSDASIISPVPSTPGSPPSGNDEETLSYRLRGAVFLWSLGVTIVYVYVCFTTLFKPFNIGHEQIWIMPLVVVSILTVLAHFLAPPIVLRFVFPGVMVAAAVTVVVTSGSVGALGIAVLLMAAALGVGDGILRLLRLEADCARKLENTLISIMAGVGVLGVTGFFLAAVHLLRAPVIALLLVIAALLSVRPLRALLQKTDSRAAPPVRERRALLALGGYVLLLNLGWAVAPEVQFDALNYHLPVAAAYAQAGGLVDLLYTHSYLSGLMETFYSMALVFGVEGAAKMIPFSLALIAAGCVYALTDRIAGRRAAAWAALLFYAIPLIMSASSTTDVDLAVSGFIATLAIGLMRWRESRQTKWLYLSAILFGGGIGVKPTMALVAPVLGGLLLCHLTSRNSEALHRRLRTVFLFLLITLTMSVPWYLLRAHFTGNPFYPVLNQWFPVHRYVPEVGPPLGGDFRIPLTPGSLVQFPASFTFNTVAYSESGVTAGGVGPYLLLALPALLLLRRRHFDLNLLCAFALTYVALWTVTFSYARFYIPIIPLVVPLAVAVLMAAARGKTWLAQGMLIAIFAGQSVVMPVQFWMTPERIPVRNALGLQSDDDFLSKVHRGIPAAKYLNRHATSGETAVGLGFERVRFYLDIPFDSWRDMPEVRQISHIRDPYRLAEALNKRGYDWLIIDEDEPDNGEKYLEQAFLECFADLRFRERQHAVYRLREHSEFCR